MFNAYLVETHELVGSVVVSGVEGGAVERNRTVKDENGKELPGDNTMSLEWNTTQTRLDLNLSSHPTPVSVPSSNVASSAPYAPCLYNSSIKAAKSRG
jgi:hypothetical protein